jgi:hypothetical protein
MMFPPSANFRVPFTPSYRTLTSSGKVRKPCETSERLKTFLTLFAGRLRQIFEYRLRLATVL